MIQQVLLCLIKNSKLANLRMTPLIYRNLISAQNALLILNEFGILSGLKLNESKTKAVWLGPWKQRTETVADPGKFYIRIMTEVVFV